MTICFVRIDDRLVHGQVATAWTKLYQLDRIIVVNNQVAQDRLRCFLLKEAAPPSVSVHIMPIADFNHAYLELSVSAQNIGVLFTNPSDVLAVIMSGASFQALNIGGMSFQTGKKMITHFVSLDEEDIFAFKQLSEYGVAMDIRKVPTDRKVFLMDILKE